MAPTYSEKKWNLKCMMKDKYLKNKMKSISESCTCPVCKKKFVKKTKAQAFCGSRHDTTCKNTYWNFMRFGTIPSPLFGYFNVLEISKKEIEEIVGDGYDVTEEEKKIVDELVSDDMLVESKELGDEEEKEYNDYVPVDGEAPFNSWSVPEDDYFI